MPRNLAHVAELCVQPSVLGLVNLDLEPASVFSTNLLPQVTGVRYLGLSKALLPTQHGIRTSIATGKLCYINWRPWPLIDTSSVLSHH